MHNQDFVERVKRGRAFLHAEWPEFDHGTTDQDRGLPVPEMDPAPPEGARCAALPAADSPGVAALGARPLGDCLRSRRSRRRFTDAPVTQEELSFLLWATQGVKSFNERRSFRTAPSGGARHPLDTYLWLGRVPGMEPGIWRYRPFAHGLVRLSTGPDLEKRMDAALMEQLWGAAVVFAWAAVPYRTEWRYAPVAHKVIALDAGHVCQNLYLACEALGLGTCGIGAYEQEGMDALLGIDGDEAFCVYAAPVGRPAQDR